MLISTGTTVPRWFSVAALYCLQNSIVWTPWGPRAVPTGGAGVAPPAGSWILTTARIFFFGGTGILLDLELGDLAEFELDGGLPAEDVDPDRLTFFIFEPRSGLLGLLHTADPGHGDLQDALDLTPRQRGRLRSRPD